MSILLELPVLLATTALFLLALAVGRWWIALLGLFGWAIYFLGLHTGWWGGPPGDFWQLAFLIEVAFGSLAVGAGLLLRRLVLKSRG